VFDLKMFLELDNSEQRGGRKTEIFVLYLTTRELFIFWTSCQYTKIFSPSNKVQDKTIEAQTIETQLEERIYNSNGATS
jgi:hypothetical protein